MKTLPDLAQVKRRGCLQRGVPEADCESVAEHSHAVATYCLVSAPIWRTEAAEVALVHDLAEVVTGDVIPADGINAEQKRSREELAFEYLESVNPSITGLKAFLDDYRNKVIPAARLVHDVDKLQRLIRAAKYAQKYPHLDFGDFKEDVTATTTPTCRLPDSALSTYEERELTAGVPRWSWRRKRHPECLGRRET
ncbi:hypothetical protein C2857_003578 [Epichloe festucae Fl1]|uniref:5'-deoxynucleotidase n=1 Tax=Epichloe festucae (strain Fl1) TaxID=877507 RepID=A0A7S9PWN9_EPIFF|nr:hypothetical protein C2857_003578 [Epichloe festucae Fl1]